LDELFGRDETTVTLNKAVKRLLLGRRPAQFIVRDKRRSGRPRITDALPHFALLSYSVLALEWAGLCLFYGIIDDVQEVSITGFWTLYNMR
jgi:hypothetical protein